ncbi:MAG: hypothetical protein OEY52_13160 [Gammaproteobacteria bacterium]|nr:hypothetical protein [Gammaproteobacteria bacterium]
MQNDKEFAEYIASLKSPWKTMGGDLNTAISIIEKYSDTGNDFSEIGFVAVSGNDSETTLSFPDWVSEIENTYIQQYGDESGKQIFKKVIMRLFLLSNGSAPNLH